MLTIRCTLLTGTFEGGRHDAPAQVEWPPSWMRLFSALVSVSSEDEDALLRQVEVAAPPEIAVSSALSSTYREAFVPTNATVTTSHSTLVARTNSVRGWARAVPEEPTIWYRWTDLDLSTADRQALQRLCRAIPYLGRSTGPAIIEIVDACDPPASHHQLAPRTAISDPSGFLFAERVRCAYPGALDALRDAYDVQYRRGGTAYPWEVGKPIDYGTPQQAPPEGATIGPYETLAILELLGPTLDGRHTARVTHAVRRAVLSRAKRHLPTLHGHHDGDVVQCAFLGLPFVGSAHADGHLLGVGVAIPPLPDDQLAVVAEALGAGEELHVRAVPLGVLRLRRISPLEASRMPRTLQPDRWVEPEHTWVSALPVVLDRFLHRKDDVEQAVRRATVNSRLPEPVRVRASHRPLLEGALDLTPRDTLRRPTDRAVLPFRHVELEFAKPVRGPVIVGAMRHYGLGLCAPQRGTR